MKSKVPVFALVMCLLLIFSSFAIASSNYIPYPDSPLGFATVNSLGQNGVTGGGNGESVIVNNIHDLRTYAAKPEPLTIYVTGTLTGSTDIRVASNKSIIGLGDDATLKWFGLNINGASNIIIRNLKIMDVRSSSDAIAIRDSHHIWIDHCDLSDAPDGLLDFTIGSDYLTVSWTKFSEHDKVSLVNSGTNHWEDHGKNKVTYHNNWFHNNVQRNPRVGYGLGHVFNNYYTNISSYGIGVHTRAKVLAENNYFYNTRNPFSQMYNTNDWEANYGDIESVGNIFEASTGDMVGTGRSFDPSYYYAYDFALLDAALVPASAFEKVGPSAEYAHLVIPVPGNGNIDVAELAPELIWIDTREVDSWDVYFGTNTNLNFKTNVTEPSYQPGNLAPDTVYYWRVDAKVGEETITGSTWRFKTALAQAGKPTPFDGEEAMAYLQSGATTVKPIEFSWISGLGAVAHNVYLGLTPELGEEDFQKQVRNPMFAPGRLPQGNTYYWRVDTVLADDNVIKGDTWSFTLPAVYAGAGRTEAEDMIFGGRFFLEYHRVVRSSPNLPSNEYFAKIESGAGALSAIWDEDDAVVNVKIAYLDQSAGRGQISLYINDELIGSVIAAKNSNIVEVSDFNDIELKKGDEITIVASSQADMLTRVDYMEIEIQ